MEASHSTMITFYCDSESNFAAPAVKGKLIFSKFESWWASDVVGKKAFIFDEAILNVRLSKIATRAEDTIEYEARARELLGSLGKEFRNGKYSDFVKFVDMVNLLDGNECGRLTSQGSNGALRRDAVTGAPA